jgi:hypothetical protein
MPTQEYCFHRRRACRLKSDSHAATTGWAERFPKTGRADCERPRLRRRGRTENASSRRTARSAVAHRNEKGLRPRRMRGLYSARRRTRRALLHVFGSNAGRQTHHHHRGIGAAWRAAPGTGRLYRTDGFQFGFCTSGQIMSAVAMIEEVKAGWPSAATHDVTRPFAMSDLSLEEIRERMSGNLCRCACYPQIVNAVEAAARS